jgi:hypothetical protein
MSTQLIGFSMAGICNRFLVTPPSMIWPSILVLAAIFNTLHSKATMGSQGHGGISRQRFFANVYISSACYSQLLLGNLHRILILHYRSVHPLLSLHCSLELLVGLLDSAQQCQD